MGSPHSSLRSLGDLLVPQLYGNVRSCPEKIGGEGKAKAFCYAQPVDEGRKRTILIAASILVARKWDQLGARPSPTLDAAITDAISLAERIMQRIDSRSRPAAPPDQSMTSSAGYPWKGQT
jgi:hypothetical protein